MKKIFTLIAAAFLSLGAQAAEDITLNPSETVAFGDWGFDNSAAPTLNFSNWSAGGGWMFFHCLSQDDYCGIDFTRYSTYPAWYFAPAIISDDYEKVVITFAEPVPDEGIQLNAESDTDSWSGTQIAALTKGASKVTAYFSAKPGVNIKSIGFYYSWNSKQGTDDQTTLKIAKAELVKKADTSTGFNTIQNLSSKENVAIYSLSGQRVSTPAKGINIIGGKKIVIK